MSKRLGIALFSLATLLIIFVGHARAHANLVEAFPEANASLDIPPAQIELVFTEPLEPSFSEIQVLDSKGEQRDAGDSRVDPADPTRMTVSLRSVPRGVYTVVWRALSTVDGHITSGAYPFAIGDVDEEALAAAAAASQQVKLSFGEVLARWMQYLSVAALTGGALFVLYVWRPAYDTLERGGNLQLPWKKLAIGALFVLLFGNVLFLLVQSGQATGAEFAPPWSQAVGRLLFTTRSGALWLTRLLLGLGLVAAVGRVERDARYRWGVFGLAALLALTISVGSHAAAEPNPILPVSMDWVHLLSASVWVGGLIHFVAGLQRAQRLDESERTKLTSILIPRFSRMALLSVGALTLTGLYSAVLRVGTLDALIGTLYGRTLVVKTLVFAPLVSLGAVNLLFITPRMKRAAEKAGGDSTLVTRFRRIVTSELTMAAVVLLTVGLLTALPPAQETEVESGLHASETADDLEIALEVEPGRVGLNTYTVTVTRDSQPVEGAKEVSLRFTSTSGKLPPSEAVLVEQGEGQYSIRGAYFGVADTWQVQAVVRREDHFDAFANYYFPVGVASTANFPWHQVGGPLALVAGVVFFFVMRGLALPSWWRGALNVGLAFGMVLSGALVFFNPPGEEGALPVNPIPPNAESLAKGEALYKEICLSCHGVTGKGDGPVGISLNPRPANLTIHTAPGVHPDGQLFVWITEGLPDSPMPAFGETLTDEQRWNLVNYIRTLSGK